MSRRKGNGVDLAEDILTHFGEVEALNGRYGLDVETLAEYRYGDGFTLDDGTLVTVLNSGEEYSEVDPDRNPMSVVYEFHYQDGTKRWLVVHGHYVSHDGGYWDGYYEGVKKTKTVTYFD